MERHQMRNAHLEDDDQVSTAVGGNTKGTAWTITNPGNVIQ